MKTLKVFMGALLVGAVIFAGCKKDDKKDASNPDITPEEAMPEPEAPTDGSRLIVIQFNGTICEGSDIVLVGGYNEWDVSDPASLIRFQKYTEEGKELADNWYYAVVPAEQNNVDSLDAKPVQLAADGSFSWDYQTGDKASWTFVSGNAIVSGGYSGEADLRWYDAACVAKSAGWKNGNYPCKVVVPEDYVVNVKCEAFVPKIIGDFNEWGAHVEMTLVEGSTYTYTLPQQAEGKSFKITNGGWDADEAILASDYNGESACYNKQGNYVLVSGQNTIELEVVGTQADVTLCE